ncbi:MAG: hypothetical protein PGN20_08145 [Agrobacterium cavarae]
MSAIRHTRSRAGMNGFRSISGCSFVIGELPVLLEVDDRTKAKKEPQMTEPLTREEMLEVRLKGIEEQLAALEAWTGADVADPDDPSAFDQARGMTEVIRYLIMYIELLTPGFSAKQLREDIHIMREAVMASYRETTGADIDDDTLEDFKRRDREVIDRCFLKSIYEDGSRPTGPFPRGLRDLIMARNAHVRRPPDAT